MYELIFNIDIGTASWPITEGLVVLEGNILSHVLEVVILDIFRVDVVHTHIHVQTSLDIILWDVRIFEILECFSHRIVEPLVLGWDPTPLNASFFRLISLFFFVFAHQCGDVLDGFFWDLVVVTSWVSSSVEIWFGFGAGLFGLVFEIWLIIDGLEVSLFFGVWVLRQCWSKIRSIHQYIPWTIKFFSIFLIQIMVVLLGIFDFRMWMDCCALHLVTALVEWSGHFVSGWLLLAMWVLWFHDASLFCLWWCYKLRIHHSG